MKKSNAQQKNTLYGVPLVHTKSCNHSVRLASIKHRLGKEDQTASSPVLLISKTAARLAAESPELTAMPLLETALLHHVTT